MNVEFISDDQASIYDEDGNSLSGSNLDSDIDFADLENPCVLAVHGFNDFGPGSFGIRTSNGFESSGEWKCTDVEEEHWFQFHFDDSLWPSAVTR